MPTFLTLHGKLGSDQTTAKPETQSYSLLVSYMLFKIAFTMLLPRHYHYITLRMSLRGERRMCPWWTSEPVEGCDVNGSGITDIVPSFLSLV